MYFKVTTLLPAVLEENHHLLIPEIILLQHTLLPHKPISKEINMLKNFTKFQQMINNFIEGMP